MNNPCNLISNYWDIWALVFVTMSDEGGSGHNSILPINLYLFCKLQKQLQDKLELCGLKP